MLETLGGPHRKLTSPLKFVVPFLLMYKIRWINTHPMCIQYKPNFNQTLLCTPTWYCMGYNECPLHPLPRRGNPIYMVVDVNMS